MSQLYRARLAFLKPRPACNRIDRGVVQRVMTKVVVVNGSPAFLDMLESTGDATRNAVHDGPLSFPPLQAGGPLGRVVFVESSDRAYSRIKGVQPHIIVLCLRMDDAKGLQLLSMLKLDHDTRAIPVLTYTTTDEDPETDEESAEEPPETALFTPGPAPMRMN